MYIHPQTKSNQSAYAEGLIELTDDQVNTYLQYNGFVKVTSTDPVTIEPDVEAWEEWKATQPDPLVDAKASKVAQSKTDLETYLETHPLTWTDGESYSITQEKQNQLMGTIAAAQIDGQPPEWNTTGGVCKEWNLAELCSLAVAIKNRVKALVKYQQAQELAINAAETREELDAIVVDYDGVEVSE